MSAILHFLSGARPQESSTTKIVLLPHQRLLHFKTTWYAIQRHSTILDKWQRQGKLIPDIEKIGLLLCDECKRADRVAPKACLEFALQRDIFSWLATLAIGGPSTLTGCIVQAYTAIIENQDEDFMVHEIISSNLAKLFRLLKAHRNKELLTNETVQLLFVICSKIHHYPPLLSIFFDGPAWQERLKHRSASNPSTPLSTTISDLPRFEEEFLIFYLLIDNMHNTGVNGDFCRTGLLYLIDSCRSTPDVQQWMAESELAIFLTVGLGSHYSLLGSDLHIINPSSRDLLLATSTDEPTRTTADSDVAILSSNADFLEAYQGFLVYLAYWQDVLVTSSDSVLHETLIECFQKLFLRNILYPSLLESSDLLDVGSAAAISTYLAAILEILTEPELVSVTLRYLLASEPSRQYCPQESHPTVGPAEPRSTLQSDPTLFSLKDMIFHNLRSKLADTQKSTFRLLDVLIRQHWPYLMNSLIRIVPVSRGRHTSIGHHEKEMKTLASLIDMKEADIFSSEVYKEYLDEAMTIFASQDKTLNNLLLLQADRVESTICVSDMMTTGSPNHTIHPSDPLLRELMHNFSTFFSNDVEFNLILTKLVSDLVACRQRSLEGWLLFSRTDSWIGTQGEIAPDHSMRDRFMAELESEMIPDLEETTLSDDDEDDDQSVDYGLESAPSALRNRILPSWSRFPPLLTMLKTLSAQLRQYKSEIDSLQDDLEQRRQIFKLGNDSEHLDSLLHAAQCAPEDQKPRPTLHRGPTSSFFRRTPSGATTPVTTPNRTSANTPYLEHFSSTKRSVSVLPSVSFYDDQDNDQNPTTPTKSRSKGPSILDSAFPPESPMRVPQNRDDGSIKLSKLVNNIIIYEEFVKELMAIIQVRRSLFEGCEFV